MDNIFELTVSVNYKSYLPLLNSEKNKCLKNLHGDLWILMHQIIKNIKKNILTKSFFLKKNISLFFICENYTLSIGFYVKLMRSCLSILK